MMGVEDRQVERPAILGYRDVDSILVNISPPKCRRLRLSQAGEEQEVVIGGVDRVFERVDGLAPLAQSSMIRPSGCSSYHSIATVGGSGRSAVRRAWFQIERKDRNM